MELAGTEQGRGALGHFPTRRYCRQRAQTSVPNVRLPFPYLSKPLSGGYSPSHRWIQMNFLYLEKVSSPTTNWATSRQTNMQETGGEWPTGQLTQRGTETTVKLPPPHQSRPSWGRLCTESFRVPFSPQNGGPVQVVLYLHLTSLA